MGRGLQVHPLPVDAHPYQRRRPPGLPLEVRRPLPRPGLPRPQALPRQRGELHRDPVLLRGRRDQHGRHEIREAPPVPQPVDVRRAHQVRGGGSCHHWAPPGHQAHCALLPGRPAGVQEEPGGDLGQVLRLQGQDPTAQGVLPGALAGLEEDLRQR